MHRALLLLCALALPVAAADLTPPVITPNVSGEAGENGWFVSDVALAWSVSDGDSAARIRSGCESTFLTEDTPGDTFLCTAASLGGGASSSYTIRRDTKPPVVSYTQNAGTYAVDQPVSIRCTASDAVSGIATTTCAPIRAPAYTFPLGLNTFATTAIDRAGNHSEGSVTFRIIVTPASLGTLVDVWVTNERVARNLRHHIARGNNAGFVAVVVRETGRSISGHHAAELIRLAAGL
ncbi:MAG TPA: hypothetical protein VEK57_08555 [Thermoanaerobaculia bacterium]|nr:hypothetical protein [Thermoanaerobaculia bacterium]